MNPASGAGQATLRHLRTLADALDCGEVAIANLLEIPTKSVVEITQAGASAEVWHWSRPALRKLITTSDQLVLGWGLGGGFTGPSRHYFKQQVEWVEEQISARTDNLIIWTIGQEPRHPSRWHQYVADKHARTLGGDFQSRLLDVLVDSSARYRGQRPKQAPHHDATTISNQPARSEVGFQRQSKRPKSSQSATPPAVGS